jgi:signal transduction histidine kinase
MQNTPVPASGERSAASEIEAEARLLEAMPTLARTLNAVPGMAMVVNRNRQVVLANQALAQFVGAAGPEELLGLRSGEILECVNAGETGQGCGTSESCSVCGSLRAITAAQVGRAQTQDCRFRRRTDTGEEALELTVSGAPLEIDGRPFTLVCAFAAGDRARRLWFEHAMLPQALALAAETEALAGALTGAGPDPSTLAQTAAMLVASSRRLTEFLREPLEMAELEAVEVPGFRETLSAFELLSAAAGELRFHEAARDRELRLDHEAADFCVETDRVLAGRVLMKMLVNALEAVLPGETVTLGCRAGGGAAELWIHNPGVIPKAVQLCIFQRSFSTKGPGRGYGTYWMKLIAERRLGGSVAFHSSPEEGTTFSVRLPLAAPAPEGDR